MKEEKNMIGEAAVEENKPAEAEEVKATEDELEGLRAENAKLSARLEEIKNLNSRIENEISEFSEMFPDTPVSEIPDSIWSEVKKGIPLSAAYARHEKRCKDAKMRAENANNAAREATSGALSGKDNDYYTPDEVKRMTAKQVKENYSKIISSMKHWS